MIQIGIGRTNTFFIERMGWVCGPEEWDSMPNDFDSTWGIVRESGVPSAFCHTILFALLSI